MSTKSKDNLSQYEKDVLASAENNHIWLNALSCIRPTDEFKIGLADQILRMLSVKENLIYKDQDSDSETRKIYPTISRPYQQIMNT